MVSRAVAPSCFSAALLFSDAMSVLAVLLPLLALVLVVVADELSSSPKSLERADMDEGSQEERSADLLER
jgi:hypothetical protein